MRKKEIVRHETSTVPLHDPKGVINRWPLLVFAGILVLGALLRFNALERRYENYPQGSDGSLEYKVYGENILDYTLQGKAFPQGTVTHKPAMSVLVAGVFGLVGRSSYVQYCTSLAVSLIAIGAFYCLMARLYGVWTALIASFCLAVNAAAVTDSVAGTSIPLMCLLLIGFFYLIVEQEHSFDRWRAWKIGLVGALLCLTREEAWYGMAGFAGVLLLTHRQQLSQCVKQYYPLLVLPLASEGLHLVFKAANHLDANDLPDRYGTYMLRKDLIYGTMPSWYHRTIIHQDFFQVNYFEWLFGFHTLTEITVQVLHGIGAVMEGLGALLTWPGLLMGLTGVAVVLSRRFVGPGTASLLMAATWVGMTMAILCPWISLIGRGDKYLVPAFIALLFLAGEGMRPTVAWFRARQDDLLHRWGPIATLAVLVGYYGYHQTYLYDNASAVHSSVGEVEVDAEDAFTALEDGDYASASRRFQRILAENSGYAPAHFGLGVADYQMANIESAQRGFSRAIDRFPWYAEAYIGMAATKIRSQDFAGGVEVLEQCLNRMPGFMPAHLLAAQTYGMLGENERGIHHYLTYMKKVSAARKDLIQWLDGYIERSRARGGQRAAENYVLFRNDLQAAFGTPKEGIMKHWRGILYTHLDHRGQYVQGGQGTTLMEIDDDRVHFRLGNLLYNSGRTQEAIERYQADLQLYPGSVASMNNLAVIYAQDGRLDEGESLLSRAIAIKPNFNEAHHNLGSLYATKGVDEISRRHFAIAAGGDKSLSHRNMVRPSTYQLITVTPETPRGLRLNN